MKSAAPHARPDCSANFTVRSVRAFLAFPYGVLYLQAIATKLMDAFGTDSTDLSLDKVCRESGQRVTAQIKG